MIETLIDLKERRSCRKFLDKQISDNYLDLILEAGTYAPTGMGRQSPAIVCIQNKELIKKISQMNAKVIGSTNDPFYNAPTLLIVLADPSVRTYLYDGSLVMGNLLNAAQALGVSSCYIFRAKEVFETEEGKELLKEWNIPTNYEGIGNCVLGYAAEGGVKPALPRKDNYIIKVK